MAILLRIIAFCFLLGVPFWGQAVAQSPLVVDLSRHLVAITTGFAGADVLLFGALERKGDVIVVVRGPERDEVVRKKDRQAGLWVDRGEAFIRNAPSFYWVAASRPLSDILSDTEIRNHGLGLGLLPLVVDVKSSAGSDDADYRQAFFHQKEESGLYSKQIHDISFLGNRLFRSELHFPANVPVGVYKVEVLFAQKGKITSAQTTPLVVSKIGLGAGIYEFSRRQSVMYGIMAVAIAVLTGWAAAFMFRKG